MLQTTCYTSFNSCHPSELSPTLWARDGQWVSLDLPIATDRSLVASWSGGERGCADGPGISSRVLRCWVMFAVSMGGGGKAHNSVFDIPTLACCKGPRTQVLLPPFPLGRKCGHGISPSPEPTGSGLQSSASKVKTYPVPLLQGILRMAPEILIFISSGRLQHLLFHNSSTSENCAADFCELNFILTVVMLLKMWPFASSFASFTHLELLESKPGWPATKVETLNSQISNKLSSGWGCARMQRHAVRSGGGGEESEVWVWHSLASATQWCLWGHKCGLCLGVSWDSEWGWGSNPLLQNLRVPSPPKPGPIHLQNLDSRQLESFFWIRTYTNTHNLVYQLQATLVLLEVRGCEGTPT